MYKHLILVDSWKDFLISKADNIVDLENIKDIETALINLDFIDPAVNEAIQKRKQEILAKEEQ